MRILCLRGGSRYGLVDSFCDAVADGFAALGHEVRRDDLSDAREHGPPSDTDLVFSFAGVGVDLDWDLPLVTWLVDNPVWSPMLFDLRGERAVFVVDQGHVSVVNEFLEVDAPCGFLPHGIEIDSSRPSPTFSDDHREIDVLVAGSFDALKNIAWKSDHPAVEAAMNQTIAMAMERRDAHMRELDIVGLYLDACRANDLVAGAEGHRAVSEFLAWLDARLRIFRRLECVQALDRAGIVQHLVGTGWEGVELEHAVLLGPVTHHSVLRLAKRAKILANLGPPLFNRGWHERIPLGLASGALVVTEHNDYLAADEHLMPLVNAFEMAACAELGDIVRDALADRTRFDRTRLGYKILRDCHTWAHRASSILEMVEP